MTRKLLLATVFAALAGTASADELSSLIDKHVAWRGGPAFERLTAVHQEGRLVTSGLTGTLDLWQDREGRVRQTLDLGALRETTAVSPAGAWTSNMSGQVEDLDPHIADDARDGSALSFAAALRGRNGATVKLMPAESHDGRQWSVVRVGFDDADTYDLFLDPATGALHGLRAVENRRTQFTTFADWRVVDGVRLPFASHTEAENAARNSDVTLTKVELNKAPPADLFERPADVAKFAFANDAGGTGWVDFDFFGGNRIYIPATVAGAPVKVLLDSGAEATVLDKRFAEKLGLKVEGELPAEGTGGSSTAGLISGVDVTIGDLTLKDLTVAVIDLEQVEKRIGRPLPVILGKEAFNQLAVDIDFKGRRIAFHDPARFTPPAGAVEVPVVEVGGLRAVELSIEGRPPVLFDFDIGNGSPLIVYPAYWEPQKLMDGRPASKTLAGAIGGSHERTLTSIKTLSFAGQEFHDVPATFPAPGAAAVDSDRTFGNVGLPVLSRFRLITDYPKDRLYLVPSADTASAPFVKDRSGLLTVVEGAKLKVAYVSPGSPAAKAGWTAGEEIAAIDGRPIGPDFADSELAKWRNRPAGQTVELTLADGSKRKLTLATYY